MRKRNIGDALVSSVLEFICVLSLLLPVLETFYALILWHLPILVAAACLWLLSTLSIFRLLVNCILNNLAGQLPYAFNFQNSKNQGKSFSLSFSSSLVNQAWIMYFSVCLFFSIFFSFSQRSAAVPALNLICLTLHNVLFFLTSLELYVLGGEGEEDFSGNLPSACLTLAVNYLAVEGKLGLIFSDDWFIFSKW